jgi:hypothetical protein
MAHPIQPIPLSVKCIYQTGAPLVFFFIYSGESQENTNTTFQSSIVTRFNKNKTCRTTEMYVTTCNLIPLLFIKHFIYVVSKCIKSMLYNALHCLRTPAPLRSGGGGVYFGRLTYNNLKNLLWRTTSKYLFETYWIYSFKKIPVRRQGDWIFFYSEKFERSCPRYFYNS